MSGSGTHAAAEFLHNGLLYHSTDFEQIGLINTSPMILVARNAVPANTLKEFVAYLRANEKKVTEADAGVGSISNLACSVFHSLAKSIRQSLPIAARRRRRWIFLRAMSISAATRSSTSSSMSRPGNLKAYAVTSDKRSPMLPDVPTTAEAGMPEFNLTVWFGLSAPKGTPRPIIEKFNKALNVALDDPDVVKRFADLGYDVAPPEKRSAAYFDEFPG